MSKDKRTDTIGETVTLNKAEFKHLKGVAMVTCPICEGEGTSWEDFECEIGGHSGKISVCWYCNGKCRVTRYERWVAQYEHCKKGEYKHGIFAKIGLLYYLLVSWLFYR